ncbi:importin-11 [Acrasis kona]|uniref:Importin-11 n=1 Tax=Acrasis kona TaxID=1008807 RepID=A0AAW2ZL97_9EUKA
MFITSPAIPSGSSPVHQRIRNYESPKRDPNLVLGQEHLPQLKSVLATALVAHSSRLEAEKTIENVQKKNGFYTLLFSVIFDTSLEYNVRYLASIILKNGVNQYWRIDTAYELSQHEKAVIKERVMDAINLEELPILTQLALVIAKIGRFDFPDKWSDLIPKIMNIIGTGSEDHRRRAILILSLLVTELSTKELSKAQFHNFSVQLIPLGTQLWNHYYKLAQEQLVQVNMPVNQTPLVITTIHVGRIMRRLICGVKSMDANKDDINTFMSSVLSMLSTLVDFRNQCVTRRIHTSELLDKVLQSLMKIPTRIHNQYPLLSPLPHYVPYVQFCLQLLTFSQHQPHKLLFRCLTFLQRVVEGSKSSFGSSNNLISTEMILSLRNSVFDLNTCTILIKCLLSRYMIMSDDDLSMWNDEPETFVKDQELDSNDSIKCAAENLFVAILENYQESCAPFVTSYTKQILDDTFGSFEHEKLLAREACYNAIGWGYYSLYENINFPNWYFTMLNKEIQIKDPRYRLVRRRACWLLGKWVEKITSGEMKQCVYWNILELLSENDLVLKLSALLTLKPILEYDLEFNLEEFEKFLDPIMTQTVKMLLVVQQEETKLTILSLLTVIMEKIGEKVIPYITSLMDYLPPIWNQSQDDALLKNAIIVNMSKLVMVLKSDCTQIHNFLVPLVQHACDVDQADNLYLLEEGLDLWQELLQNSPLMTVDVLGLFKNIVKMIKTEDWENIMMVMKIIDSYTLLGKDQFLNVFQKELCEIFMATLGNLKDHGTILCVNVIETLLVLFPTACSQCFASPLDKIFISVLKGQESNFVRSNYICLLARILLASRPIFDGYIARASALTGTNAVHGYVDVWINMVDQVVSALKRKIGALSLLCLYPTDDIGLNQRFPEVVDLAVRILYEVEEVNQEIAKRIDYDEDEQGQQEQEEAIDESHEYGRKRMLLKNDSAVHINVYQFLQNKFAEMQQVMGAQQFQALLNTVKPEVMRQLQDYKK